MNKIISGILLLTLMGVSNAETLFSDDFENGLGLWDDTYQGIHGQIVTDPLVPGNKVLNFTTRVGGGDIFSTSTLQGQTGGDYILSFDYLGTCGTASCGGFIGISVDTNPAGAHTWVGGTAAPYPDLLPDDGAWHHVTIPINTAFTNFHLMLEEWHGAGDLVASDAYFDNIQFTDANGPTPEAVPIPLWTWFILILFLGLFGLKPKFTP